MRRFLAPVLAGLLLAGLCGCTGDSGEEAETGTYQVYYSALDDHLAPMALGYEERELGADVQLVPALLKELLAGPDTQGLTSPFPEGVRLLSWQIEEGCLHLDLSEQYGSLTGVDLTIADACLVLTFSQVADVESVYVTVEGSEIPYRPIQQLTPSDLLLSNGQESPPPQENVPESSNASTN